MIISLQRYDIFRTYANKCEEKYDFMPSNIKIPLHRIFSMYCFCAAKVQKFCDIGEVLITSPP